MYTVGSMCYGIYFIVSFPMYYRCGGPAMLLCCALFVAAGRLNVEVCAHRLDEGAQRWTWSQAAIDSLGSCMLVTIMLDLWRLTVGGVLPNVPSCVPYM